MAGVKINNNSAHRQCLLCTGDRVGYVSSISWKLVPPELVKKSKTIKVVALAQSVYILSLLNNKPFNAVSREQISCDFLIIIRLGGFHALSTPLPHLSDEEDPFLFFPESSQGMCPPPLPILEISFKRARPQIEDYRLFIAENCTFF